MVERPEPVVVRIASDFWKVPVRQRVDVLLALPVESFDRQSERNLIECFIKTAIDLQWAEPRGGERFLYLAKPILMRFHAPALCRGADRLMARERTEKKWLLTFLHEILIAQGYLWGRLVRKKSDLRGSMQEVLQVVTKDGAIWTERPRNPPHLPAGKLVAFKPESAKQLATTRGGRPVWLVVFYPLTMQ